MHSSGSIRLHCQARRDGTPALDYSCAFVAQTEMSPADLKKVLNTASSRGPGKTTPGAVPLDRPDSVEDIEISLLLEGVFRLLGYDFRQYSPVSLRRRIREVLAAEKLGSISALQDRVLHQPEARDRFVS